MNYMVEIKGITGFTPGTIRYILQKSYTDFFEYFPAEREKLYYQWEKEDCDAFEQKHIGDYVAFSCINDLPVGYFSWDPRQFPIGIIGQNCIIPKFRGKGYGNKQVEWMINWFKKRNFLEIEVITGDHPFFFPARQMYKKCGFDEKAGIQGRLFDLVEFIRNFSDR